MLRKVFESSYFACFCKFYLHQDVKRKAQETYKHFRISGDYGRGILKIYIIRDVK